MSVPEGISTRLHAWAQRLYGVAAEEVEVGIGEDGVAHVVVTQIAKVCAPAFLVTIEFTRNPSKP